MTNTGGIREKLVRLTLIPVLVCLSLVFAYFGYQSINHSYTSMKDRGQIITGYLSSMAEFAVATGNMNQLDEFTRVFMDGDLLAFRIYDINNQLMMEKGEELKEIRQQSDTFPAAVHHCNKTQNSLVFCAPITTMSLPVSDYPFTEQEARQRIIGRVELALSDEKMRKDRQEFIVGSLAAVISLLFILLFFIRRVEQQITQPISELTRSVSLISDGASDVRIDVKASGEFKVLQDGFNNMAKKIDSHKAEMESRINMATRKLNDAMLELENKNRELEKQIDVAQSASKAKSLFLATMSHEIRTPLSGLIGILSLIDRDVMPREQRGYLDHMEQATTSLRMLIEDVLDFSRIEAGKLNISSHPCSPVKSIEGVAMMLAHSAQEKKLEMIVSIDPHVPLEIMGDEVRFRQVLINLLGNAIKFTEQGHIMIALKVVSREQEKCRMRIEVSDSGIGIDKAKQKEIFDGFTQIDTSMTRKHGGSGLGTTISRELVRLMGGSMGLESEAGKGSRFWFELDANVIRDAETLKPLANKRYLFLEHCGLAANSLIQTLQSRGAHVGWCTDEDELIKAYQSNHYDIVLLCENSVAFTLRGLAETLQQIRGERSDTQHYHATYINGATEHDLFDGHLTKPLTLTHLQAFPQFMPEAESVDLDESKQHCLSVLLAEDDRINATVVMSFLKRMGHRCHHVSDGEAALHSLQSGIYDIVVMDLRMPLMDGLSVARQWREQEGDNHHLPIIALTANASEEDRQACLAAGMDDFLTKPVSIEQLASMLDKYTG